MEKIYGTTVRQDGLQRIGRDTWVLFFGLYETTDEGTYEYRHTFKHRPTLDEIKAVINAQLSADADERKRNGFSWQGVPVRYDEEAERNITGLSVKDAEEFESFTDALLLFSQECYAQAWQAKAEIDWNKFTDAL